MERKEITPADAGLRFAGASNRTADELNVAVIGAALEYGWEPDDKTDLEALDADGWFDDPDLAEYAADSATRAETYLNGIAPDGYFFGFDDGFYLLPVCAWDWFHDADECPHGDDCPSI